MFAKLSLEEQREFMLLLEVQGRPKLARVSGAWPPPPSPSNHINLREAIERGNKRAETTTPEEAAQRESDEDELLKWFDREGKNQKLHPVVLGDIRVARAKREPPADNSPTPRQEYVALLAARAAKPAAPEVKQEQSEPLKPPAKTEVRRPTSVMEALNRPTREPMQIGESLGSFFIRIRP